MPTILSKALSLITGDEKSRTDWLTKMPAKRPLREFSERDLIRLESEIGSTLFGPLPKGRRREFFCLDATTWIWHEEWIDENRQHHVSTTKYEVQSQGILKVSENSRYSYLEGQEFEHFIAAINMYYERVSREIYRRDPDTGQKLDQ